MKKLIDILAIVLPALLLIIGLWGLPNKNRSLQSNKMYQPSAKVRMLSALKILLYLLLLLIGIIRYLFFSNDHSGQSELKPEPLSVSKHSIVFNKSIQTMLNAYYKMTEAFVSLDTASISKYGTELKIALDSLQINELQKDTAIYLTALDPLANAKTEVNSILADPSINEKRGSLNILSDNIRNLLVIVKYDQAKIYWQECPMAFGEDRPGNWLSKTIDVRNPYLGTKDPQHKDEMLNCGGPKDTINFIMTDTTKK
jgi:Protein of unknown function (DUF3347)